MITLESTMIRRNLLAIINEDKVSDIGKKQISAMKDSFGIIVYEIVFFCYFEKINKGSIRNFGEKGFFNDFFAIYSHEKDFFGAIVHYFNSFSKLPKMETSQIPPKILILLLIGACYSVHEKSSFDILFSLCNSRDQEIFFEDLPNEFENKYQDLISKKNKYMTNKNIELCVNVKHPVTDALLEFFENDMLEELYLRRIYMVCGLNSIGRFIYEIMSFKGIFNDSPVLQKALFSSLKGFLSKSLYSDMIMFLDINDEIDLSDLIIERILKFFIYYSGLDYIDAHPFLNKWKNPLIQKQFLYYFAANNKSILKFDGNPDRICWSSPLYMKVIIEFFYDYISDFIDSMYSYVSLALFSVLNITDMKKSTLDSFLHNISSCYFSTKKQYLHVIILWEKFPNQMGDFSIRYAQNSIENVISVVNATPTTFIDHLIHYSPLDLSFDIAIASSWYLSYNFVKYIRFVDHLGKLSYVIDRINNHLIEKNYHLMISDVIINSIFDYVSINFEQIPYEIRLNSHDLYKKFKEIRPAINEYDFHFEIKKIDEKFQEKAKSLLNPYLNLQIGTNDLDFQLEKIFQQDAEFYNYILMVIFQELRNWDILMKRKRDSLRSILIELIHNKWVNKGFYQFLFQYIEDSLKTIGDRFGFACELIEMVLPFLDSNILFGSKLLQSFLLYFHYPSLFRKVKEKLLSYTFKEFVDTTPIPNISKKVRVFENLQTPPIRNAKNSIPMTFEYASIIVFLEKFKQYPQWVSNCFVLLFLEDPSQINTFIQVYSTLSNSIQRTILYCIVYHIYKIIFNTIEIKYFNSPESKKVWILGRILGLITLGNNYVLVSSVFDIKSILLYALSNGLLFVIVPMINSILTSASRFFSPPNPYISSILQLLGSIYSIKGLKGSICRSIESIFLYFHVSINDLLYLDELFPDQTQNNYDFVLIPFSLKRLFTDLQIERIIMFDENWFYSYLSSNVIYSEPEIILTFSERVYNMVIWLLYQIIREESDRLSKIISSTIDETIKINKSHGYSKKMLIYEAECLITQLAESVLSQIVFFNFHFLVKKLFDKELHNDINDNIWVDDFCSKNQVWVQCFIVELCKHICSRKARTIIDSFCESKTSTNLPVINYLRHIKCSFTQNICYLSSSVLDSHIAFLKDLCMMAQEQGYFHINHLPANHILLKKLVQNVVYDNDLALSFNSFWKEFGLKNCSLVVECLEFLFLRFFKGIVLPNSFHNNILSTISNEIVFHYYYSIILTTSLISVEELDNALTKSISNPLITEEQVIEIIFLLNEEIIISGRHQISDFQNIIFWIIQYRISDNDQINQIIENLVFKYLQNNKKVISGSSNKSKRDITYNNDFSLHISKWIQSLSAKNEVVSMKLFKNFFRNNLDLYQYVLLNEPMNVIEKFLIFIDFSNELSNSIDGIFNEICNVLLSTSIGNHYKMFQTLSFFIGITISNPDNFDIISHSLHYIRPNILPSFCFLWFDLVSSSSLLVSLATENYSWPIMLLLVSDMVAFISKANNFPQPTIFQRVYMSFIRYLLVLSHEFPDFLSSSASYLLSLLPSEFVQARNIILSTSPKYICFIPLNTPEMKIEQVLDIHQIHYSIMPMSSFLPDSLHVSINNYFESRDSNQRNNEMIIICDFVSKNPGVILSLISLCFEITFPPKIMPIPKPLFTHLPYFILMCSMLSRLDIIIVENFIDCFADNLKFPCRNTHFYIKLLIELFRKRIVVGEAYCISEIIVYTLVKRMASPPYPWGLQVLLCELIFNKDLQLFEMSFVSSNTKCQRMLDAIGLTLNDIQKKDMEYCKESFKAEKVDL